MTASHRKTSFEFRDKLESWVEGIIDTLAAYLKTVFLFNLRPFESKHILTGRDEGRGELTQPGVFMLISYFAMALLLRDVDFNDPVFAFNLARLLDVLGLLNAAKSLSVENIIVGVLPAIGLLFFFVYLSGGVLRLFGEQVAPATLRRRYSYFLGNVFLLVGVASSAYFFVIKPISHRSWNLGLALHTLTILFFSVGLLMLALCPFPDKPNQKVKATLVRTLARVLPWLVITAALRLLTGSWSFINYYNAR